LSETKEFVRRLVGKPEGAFALAIRFRDDARVIGVVEFGSRGELGGVDYSLAEELWNQGIMTEAVQATIDWAFRTLPTLRTISSSAMPVNRGSTRVMEKCGMAFKRLVQDKFERLDEPVTVAEYVIDRQAWQRQQS
jgi:RimJ/RimL family protein N-acetyltransferase